MGSGLVFDLFGILTGCIFRLILTFVLAVVAFVVVFAFGFAVGMTFDLSYGEIFGIACCAFPILMYGVLMALMYAFGLIVTKSPRSVEDSAGLS